MLFLLFIAIFILLFTGNTGERSPRRLNLLGIRITLGEKLKAAIYVVSENSQLKVGTSCDPKITKFAKKQVQRLTRIYKNPKVRNF